MPGERSFPCVNCGARMTVDAKACPGCGLVPSSLNAVAQTPLSSGDPGTNLIDRLRNAPYPIDWTIEPYPDGTVALRKNGFAKFNNVLPWVVPVLVGCLVLFLFSFARIAGTTSADATGVGAILLRVGLGFVFFGSIAVTTFTRLELRAGPAFLEIRRTFLQWESVKRITTVAFLRVETVRSENRMIRTLVVENMSGRHVLDCVTVGDYNFLLHTYGALSTDTPDAASTLGRFLAAQTGWQFSDSLSRGTSVGKV